MPAAPLPWPPLRFSRLLAASSLGVLAVVLASRALLRLLPSPDPQTPAALLQLQQHWALNPERRRQAALLRAGLEAKDPRQRQRLLRGQGWGHSPEAAVALKQQALAAEALESHGRSQALWQLLIDRHSGEPASADGLYALGRNRPQLRQLLLQRWPAHPAALAAASEGPQPAGALHLARWGARWPGAAARLTAACQRQDLRAQQRQQLAQGLAELGLNASAQGCLGSLAALPATQLLLASTDLQGTAAQQQSALGQLQALIRQHPGSAQAREAAVLLAETNTAASAALLARLPRRWQDTAAVQAGLALQQRNTDKALTVLHRWPGEPISWELQWQLARAAALDGRWATTRSLLLAGGPKLDATMPLPLQARRQFWLGLSQWQLGQRAAATRLWRELVRLYPGGYYGWRAAERLGGSGADAPPRQPPTWHPLRSSDHRVDLLWQLGQPLEAWEAWRSSRGGQRPRDSAGLLAEGRLREAIGDGWAGLGLQALAAQRLKPGQCALQQLIDTSLYRPRQRDVLEAAARSSGVGLSLLQGVAQQESRFQSDARSVVGAAGLLQLMPATAAEVAGHPLREGDLHDPRLNASLGARYLAQLLQRWRHNPLLAVASYNAGPNAVAQWRQPDVDALPELWVEAIPYPETRHYVKTVLGNTWSYSAQRLPKCNESLDLERTSG